MIDLIEVTHSYGGTRRVLDSVSLTIAAGTMTAITGPSGRGKSTLLLIAGLLLRPESGRVVVAGVDATRMPDRRRSALRGGGVAFVFQDAMLDTSRSVLDNVVESAEYGTSSRRRARARAVELLDDLGVGIDIRRRPGQISGGQAQRVALCRALLPRPSVILADEPTGNLDAASAQVVLDRLRREAEAGVAVAVATHDERVMAGCDRVHALD